MLGTDRIRLPRASLGSLPCASFVSVVCPSLFFKRFLRASPLIQPSSNNIISLHPDAMLQTEF